MAIRTSPEENAVENARVLVFSLRNIFMKDLYRCPLYEFEDTIAEIDHAAIVAPNGNPLSRRNEFAQRLAFHAPMFLKAEIEKVKSTKRYDLFFTVCGSPRDLLVIDAARYLWDACSIKVCLIDELWVREIPVHRHLLRVLKGFDLIALYYSGTVEPLSEQVGRPCFFVPPGIDAVRFSPPPQRVERVVDIYSVGRRSETTHRAILRMAKRRNLLYLHDSIDGTKAIQPTEHRNLFASIAKRSKYFIVNPGQIDQPERRGGQMEIGNRYFEGIAAGTILIGEIPKNGEFEKLFDWPDAVIHLPYGSENVDQLFCELEGNSLKLEGIRNVNVVQALTRHDWAYRWETILRRVGLESTPGLSARKARLSALAEVFMGDGDRERGRTNVSLQSTLSGRFTRQFKAPGSTMSAQ